MTYRKRGNISLPDQWKTLLASTGQSKGGKSYTSISNIFEYGQTKKRMHRRNTTPTTQDIPQHDPPETTRVRGYESLEPGILSSNEPPLTTSPNIALRQFNTDTTAGYGYGNYTSYWPWPGVPNTEQQQNPLTTHPEVKYTTDELKGKLIAYATIAIDGVKHNGVLFVRKCGAWKLIECETMKKISGGGKESPLPEVTVHYIIYSHFEEDNNRKKKGRFEDIDMNK